VEDKFHEKVQYDATKTTDFCAPKSYKRNLPIMEGIHLVWNVRDPQLVQRKRVDWLKKNFSTIHASKKKKRQRIGQLGERKIFLEGRAFTLMGPFFA